ncbi:MAG: hypothetical protein FIB05_15305 [Betaproteobacteria bacterium]|nr:hypothetical protein [Betaproteobacteria bacterium]PWB63938.1 MAG: hypothetical protein C3F16_04430 [Betaproteobacteria bacterium]
MKAARRIFVLLLVALGLASCVVYEPVPVDPMEAPWRAAIGAMQDNGLAVATADRTSGVIRGTRAGAEGTIVVRMRNDGRVGVEINSQGEPGLTQRLTDAYNRRMGR